MAKRKNTMTSTVPLSGGPADHIPEFLQEAPSMAYVENGRFRQDGEIEKTQPHTQVDDSEGQLPSTVVGLSQVGDKLVAVGPDGSTFLYPHPVAADTDDWLENDTRLVPSVNTKLFTVGNDVAGMRHVTHASVGNVVVTAADFTEPLVTDSSPNTRLRCEARSASGDIMAVFEYDGGACPQAVTHGGGALASVFYVDIPNLNLRRVTYNILTRVFTDASLSISVGSASVDEPLETPGLAQFDNNPLLTNSNERMQYRNAWRAGFCQDGGNTGFLQVAYNADQDVGMLFYNSNERTVVARELTSAGAPTGSAWTVGAGTITVDGFRALACAVGDTSGDNRFFTMHCDTTCSSSGTDSDLVVQVWDESHSLVGSGTTVDTGAGHYVNGTIATSSNADWQAAWTRSKQDPYLPRSSSGMCEVGWANGNSSSSTSRGSIPSHRLASKGNISLAGFEVAVQQWANIDPYGVKESSNEGPQPSPLWNKTNTTALLRLSLTTTDDYFILATFDASQSKCMPGSSSEQSPHLGTLEVVDDGYRYINRVSLEPEDLAYFVTTDAGVPADNFKRRCVLSPGLAVGRAYQVDFNVVLRAREYGDAAYFDSSCPSLFDGQLFGEAFVLDSPEILEVEPQNYREEHQQYTITHGENAAWKSFQAVVGFVDATGAVHRSAPSSIVYLGPVDAAGTFSDFDADDEQGATVGVTMPLTAYLPEDRKYFVEVYTGIGTNDLQLAHTKFIERGSVDPEGVFLMNLWASDAGWEFVRNTETVYTAGELAADTWPDFSDFVISGRRMFAISSGTPGTIYYSKLFAPRIAPEFSAVLTIEMGQNRQLTALGVIDEKVIIFEEDTISVLSNSGPDNTGNNGDFFLDNIQTTVGCSDPESVVETPDGLMFYSSQTNSFWILSRDMQILEIGEAIEDVSFGFDCTGAIHYAAEQEVRFYGIAVTSGEYGEDPDTGAGVPARPPRPRYVNRAAQANVALVYNYKFQRWTVIELPDRPTIATRWLGAPTFVDDDGDVFQVDNTWSNSDTLKYRSPWVRMANLQTFGLLEEITFVGKYLSDWKDNGGGHEAGDIQVTVAYDYETGSGRDEDVYLFRANVDLNDPNLRRLQFSVHPGRKNCQAFQVTVEEVDTTKADDSEPAYARGRGFALSGMDIVYTPKTGTGSRGIPQRVSK